MPAETVAIRFAVASRGDVMVLIGLLELLGEILVDLASHPIQLTLALTGRIAGDILAFKMGFQVIGTLACDTQGHLNGWLHRILQYLE